MPARGQRLQSMPRVTALAVVTPFGGLEPTLAALSRGCAAHADSPETLGEPLVDTLRRILAELGPADAILLATTKGDLPLWNADLSATNAPGSPTAVARELGATVVSAACASGPLALGEAARMVLSGRARRVAVIAGDRLGPFVHEGFAALQALDPHGCRPFARERQGLVLGEAAAGLMVSADATHDTDPWLSGWGASLDAHHLTGPARDGAGLAAACRLALARAQLARPAAIIAHGTGTRHNDAAEACAYHALFAAEVPVTAWKGCFGHTLGTCGLLEAALATAIIRDRRLLPGCIRVTDADMAVTLLPPGGHRLGGALLSPNAGFGGINGAVVIGGGPPLALRQVTPTLRTRVMLEPPWGPLTARDVLGHGEPTWGRMDLPCRVLTALAVRVGELPRDTAVILLTDSGSAATDRRFEHDRRAGHPDAQCFAYTLPTTAIGEASIRCGLHGPGFALMNATDAAGRATAHGLLAEGSPAVLLARVEADQPPHCAWAEVWT